MALSKPQYWLYNLTSAYFESLYTSPVKTKAFTSCAIAVLGNLLSQKVSGSKYLNEDSLIAFGLFGLLFGGPLPHYFYLYIHRLIKNPVGILLIERALYTPCFVALALYMLARFEGKTHQLANEQLKKLYWPILIANLKYLTLPQYINIKFVPPILRVLVVNLIGLLWSVYVSTKRAKSAKDTTMKK